MTSEKKKESFSFSLVFFLVSVCCERIFFLFTNLFHNTHTLTRVTTHTHKHTPREHALPSCMYVCMYCDVICLRSLYVHRYLSVY